jgi:DNA-binding transcriptional LysR family regulator
VKLDWNDLRFFAAVLEHGTTAGAARAIGVDQTTVARRITALEAALGIDLFERDHAGYRPTPAAEVLQPSVQSIAEQVMQFVRDASTAERQAKRRIRITGEDTIMRILVVPALTRFAADHPDIQLEIDLSPAVRDLLAGEADIAVRAGPAPEEPSLVRRKLSESAWAIYCSTGYAAAHGVPQTMAELVDHPFVALDVGVPEIRAFGIESSVRQVVTALSSVEAIIRTGACVGAMPCITADAIPDLVKCFPAPTSSAVWLVYPERLRRAPEMKILSRYIVEAFK